MFVKYYPNRLTFFVNILAIVRLGCIFRFSHILPEIDPLFIQTLISIAISDVSCVLRVRV